MKLIITLIFSIIFGGSIIVDSNKQNNLSLRQAFSKINEVTAGLFDQQPVDEFFQKSVNLTCIEASLKLDKIGRKVINKSLTKWIFAMTSFKCMTDDQKNEFLTLFITNGFKIYEHEAGGHRCSKLLLLKTDPSSKMIENFDEDLDDVEVELCEQLLIADALDSIVDEYIGDFDEPECVERIREHQKRFMVVFLNLAVEDDQEVLEFEMKNCVEVIKGNIAEVFECLMNKLD
ncbi:hypothetical protein ACKWTF_014822 [Chironomus riparius]